VSRGAAAPTWHRVNVGDRHRGTLDNPWDSQLPPPPPHGPAPGVSSFDRIERGERQEKSCRLESAMAQIVTDNKTFTRARNGQWNRVVAIGVVMFSWCHHERKAGSGEGAGAQD